MLPSLLEFDLQIEFSDCKSGSLYLITNQSKRNRTREWDGGGGMGSFSEALSKEGSGRSIMLFSLFSCV